MSDRTTVIKANISGLSEPASVAQAAAAVDGAYKRLWADVYDHGTLAALRHGLLARNALYEGNAIAAIYRILCSGHPAAREATTASHILSILAALLQDVPAAFAAEGYGHLIDEAMDEGELIIPDFSELNAMRAQPVFVSLALNTLLDRPQSSDHDPHISVGYINDLIGMDGVDFITSTALQGLLKDGPFRAALFRGLHSTDEHKLFKCLQLLKRCVGGGPGMLGGFSSIHNELSPPWSLQQLLDLGAEEPLVTACNTVAAMVRQHSIKRELLGLLHTTLLDIFDLLCAGDGSAGSSGGGGNGGRNKQGTSSSSAAAAAAPADSGGNAQGIAGRQQVAAGSAAVGAPHGGAAPLAAQSSSSSYGAGETWPAALVAAHLGLVLEVSQLVPMLVTCLCRMQPYAAQPTTAAALEARGAEQCMAALVAVLAAGNPSDWLMLGLQTEGFQVMHSLVQHKPQLATAVLQAGAAGTIFAALVAWAAYLPVPTHSEDLSPEPCPVNEDLEHEPHFDHSQHGPQQQHIAVDSLQQGSRRGSPCSACEEAAEMPSGHTGGRFVDPQVAGAAAAALQLLCTLLTAAAGAASIDPGTATPHAAAAAAEDAVPSVDDARPKAAAAAPAPAAEEAHAVEVAPAEAISVSIDMPAELPALLLELWHIQALQSLAAECLTQLQKLGLLTAATVAATDGTFELADVVSDRNSHLDLCAVQQGIVAPSSKGQQHLGYLEFGISQGIARLKV